MKKTIKNFLSAVLAASLLAGFSVSVASFASGEIINEGGIDFFCVSKEVVGNISNCNVYEIIVSNSKVAKTNEIDQDPLYDDIYYLIDAGTHYSIREIVTRGLILFVPNTFSGKKVVVDEKFIGFSWPPIGGEKWICVPERMKKSFEQSLKNLPCHGYAEGAVVVSYDELIEQFVEHLFD